MASRKKIVVTGLGVLCASGTGMQPVWESCRSGFNAIRSISRFNSKRFRCQAGGEVDGFEASRYVHQPIIPQTDRSTHLGMAACQLAVADAALSLKDQDPNEVGMYFSNLMGGMDFAEPELYAQTFLGPNRVNAYQAIAWFYAAAQGQWSIQTGIKGHAKTIVADRTGGLQSIGLAAHAIRRGHCRVAFSGGFEAPLVPYAYLMYGTTGMLARDTTDPLLAYRPFHRRRQGLVLGEGSGILLLENMEHAVGRGARIYAEVAGFSVSVDAPMDPPGSGLVRCFQEALHSADLQPSDIHHINAEGTANETEDAVEATAIHKVFGGLSHPPTVSAPKSMFGHTLAAAGAIDAALACRMIEENTVLPTLNLDDPDPELGPLSFNRNVEKRPVDTVLCCSRGLGGLNTALILRRCNAN